METLFSRRRNTAVLIAVLFLQLVLLAWQVKRPGSDVPLLRQAVQAVLLPPQKALSGSLQAVSRFWQNYVDLRGARDESRRLLEELSRQQILNHQLREEAQELDRLKALLAYREQSPSTLLAARVIGSNAGDTSRVIFLNKGQEDGLRPNMAVITPDGIVGKVQRVFGGSAQVLLITDLDSGVGCLLENSRVHGVLKGQNSHSCQLRYVLNDEKVETGDRILTSGEDRIYPKGLPVGTVAAVRSGPVFKEITVQPLTRLNRLEEVLVVIKGVDQEVPAPPAEATVPVSPTPATPLPQAPAPATEPAVAGEQQPASAGGAYRPGISRSARPETDADRVRAAYRRRLEKQAGSGTPGATAAQAAPQPPGTTAPGPGAAAAPGTTGTRPAPAARPKPPAQPAPPPPQR